MSKLQFTYLSSVKNLPLRVPFSMCLVSLVLDSVCCSENRKKMKKKKSLIKKMVPSFQGFKFIFIMEGTDYRGHREGEKSRILKKKTQNHRQGQNCHLEWQGQIFIGVTTILFIGRLGVHTLIFFCLTNVNS